MRGNPLDGSAPPGVHRMCAAFPEYVCEKVYDAKKGRKRERERELHDEDEFVVVSALKRLRL